MKWQTCLADFCGCIHRHTPADPLLKDLSSQIFLPSAILKVKPITATLIFLDRSTKIYKTDGTWDSHPTSPHQTLQHTELTTVHLALSLWSDTWLNIVSDSTYVCLSVSIQVDSFPQDDPSNIHMQNFLAIKTVIHQSSAPLLLFICGHTMACQVFSPKTAMQLMPLQPHQNPLL